MSFTVFRIYSFLYYLGPYFSMGNFSKSKTKISLCCWEFGKLWHYDLTDFFFLQFYFWKELCKHALLSVTSVLRPAKCLWTRTEFVLCQLHCPSHTDRLQSILWTGTLAFVVLKIPINSDKEMWATAIYKHSAVKTPGFPGSCWGLSETFPHGGKREKEYSSHITFSIRNFAPLLGPYCSLAGEQVCSRGSSRNGASCCLVLGIELGHWWAFCTSFLPWEMVWKVQT